MNLLEAAVGTAIEEGIKETVENLSNNNEE